jgi:hypothetical protein
MGISEADVVNGTVKISCGETLLLKLGGTYVLVTAAPPNASKIDEPKIDPEADELIAQIGQWQSQTTPELPDDSPWDLATITTISNGTLKLDLDGISKNLKKQSMTEALSLRSLTVGERLQLVIPGDYVGAEDLAEKTALSEHGTRSTNFTTTHHKNG